MVLLILQSGLLSEQLFQVENITNELVRKNYPVYSAEVPLDVGKSISGLRAVFGEVKRSVSSINLQTYPDPVRVVSVGAELQKILQDPQNEKWKNYSIEFCGGT